MNLDEWPNCTTPDCGNKACTWAGLTLCHPCGVALLGRGEMDRRYDLTHEKPLAALQNAHDGNYMTAVFDHGAWLRSRVTDSGQEEK